MDTHTNLPTEKLSSWYYAVRWGGYHIQQSIKTQQASGLSAEYDVYQLQQLEDLEQFLKMSWDTMMDQLCGKPLQTVEEVTYGDS